MTQEHTKRNEKIHRSYYFAIPVTIIIMILTIKNIITFHYLLCFIRNKCIKYVFDKKIIFKTYYYHVNGINIDNLKLIILWLYTC